MILEHELGFLDGSFYGSNEGKLYLMKEPLGKDWHGREYMAWLWGGYHATSKGVELIYELNYSISFWTWILLWKSLHFVEISTFHG